MEYVIGLLDTVIQDRQMAQYAFIGLMAVAVFCLALAGMYLVSTMFHPVRSRLHNVVAPEAAEARREGHVSSFFKSTAPHFLPKKEGDRSRTRERLIHAGFRNEGALANFYAIKTLLIVGLPLAVFFGLRWMPGLTTIEVVQAAAGAMLVGALGPIMYWPR